MVKDFYLRRDDLQCQEKYSLLKLFQELPQAASIDHAGEENHISKIRQEIERDRCDLRIVTDKEENIACLCSYEDQTDLLLEVISKTIENKYLLRRNKAKLNAIGNLLRSEITLNSLEKVIKCLINRGVVSQNVLIVIVYHQWLVISARDKDYKVRSLKQITNIMQKFKLFDELTESKHISDLDFGLEIRRRKRQTEILATLLHEAVQDLMPLTETMQLGFQKFEF